MDNYRNTISDLIGNYWGEIFQDDLKKILDLHQGYASAAEDTIRRIKATISEPGVEDTLIVTHRAFTVPETVIGRTRASGTDSMALYSDSPLNTHYADELSWTIDVGEPLEYVRQISPFLNSPLVLLPNIDFKIVGKELVMYKNPYEVFPRTLTVEDNKHVYKRSFILEFTGKDDGGYNDRFGFYRTIRKARQALFNLIVQEGSINRVLEALQITIDIIPPTIYEQVDDGGNSYTEVVKFWNTGKYTYALTSGGEIVKVPLALRTEESSPIPEPEFDHGSKLYSGEPLTSYIEAKDRITETKIAGLWFKPPGTEGLVVPNSRHRQGNVEDDLPQGEPGYRPRFNLQIRGKTADKDLYYSKLYEALEKAGKTPEEVFLSGSSNPVEQLYDRLDRPQPSAIHITGEAVAAVAGAGDLLQACLDSIPAGSGTVVGLTIEIEDTFPLKVVEGDLRKPAERVEGYGSDDDKRIYDKWVDTNQLTGYILHDRANDLNMSHTRDEFTQGSQLL